MVGSKIVSEWKLVALGTKHMSRRLEFLYPVSNLGKGERLETELITNASDLTNHSKVMEPPENPLTKQFRELWVMSTPRCWRLVAQRGHGSFPYLALCISYI